MTSTAADTYPRQYARTQRLTLGEPRNVSVSPDGSRVVFLRSRGGSDPVNCLWVLDVASGDEKLVADPKALLAAGLGGADEDLTPEEKARRERLREGAGGITSYATDRDVTVYCCTLSGKLFVGGLVSATARELEVKGPVFDPRPDPTAKRIAYVSGSSLRVAELDGESREIAGPALFRDPDNVTWGSADFIAAEEMGRYRGYWWSPDGERIAVCRVDDAPVNTWYISDPTHPEAPPTPVKYPAAGTDNARVTLHVISLTDGTRTEVQWDRKGLPYLADVTWVDNTELLITTETRDQKTLVVSLVNAITGVGEEIWSDTSDTWVDLVPGSPDRLPDRRLVVVADRDGWKRLLIGGIAVTGVEINVRSVVSCDASGVVFMANPSDHPEALGAWRWTDEHGIHPLTATDGMHSIATGGPTVVVRRASASLTRAVTSVTSDHRTTELVSLAEAPLVSPRPVFARRSSLKIPTALLLPTGHVPGTKLPVLIDPYGGPHAQRVVDSHAAHCTSQWFADQGFAVLVADGRGTPGLGTAWERSVHLDLATHVLQDQVDALHATAAEYPDLDLSRVGIRGWSFGGYLAALAVLRRPDVFHAAVAGAPVTEWRLYDTHYTERYLGDPTVDAAPYDSTSLLRDAHKLSRPLLLVHGLTDDNVVAAHTLQLSSALLTAGRPHEVLPLSGVTHMTPQPEVAENLLLHQLDFLKRSLGGF